MASFKIPENFAKGFKSLIEDVKKLNKELSKTTIELNNINNSVKSINNTPNKKNKITDTLNTQSPKNNSERKTDKEKFATAYLDKVDKQTKTGLKSFEAEAEKQGEEYNKNFEKGIKKNKSKNNTDKENIKTAQKRGTEEGKAYATSFEKSQEKIIKKIGNDLYKQYMNAYKSRDMQKLGELDDVLLERLGGDDKKLSSIRNSISKQASSFYYGDAVYGAEARELKNIMSYQKNLLSSASNSKSNNIMKMLSMGYNPLKNPQMFTGMAYDKFYSKASKKALNSIITGSDEYKAFAKKNENATVESFMKQNPKAYAQVLKKIPKSKSSMEALSAAGMSAMGKAGAVGAVIALAAAVGKLGKESVEAYESIETLRTRLGVIYSTQSMADNAFAQIENYATKSPFGVEQMTQQAILLKQSGVNGSDLMDVMGRIGDLSSGNAEKMNSISEVYARVLASTTVTARDMRQLANAGVPAYDALLDVLKTGSNPNIDKNQVTSSNIRSLLQSGKITSQDFTKMIETLTDEGGTFHGATKKGAQTIQARKQNLSDTRQIALSKVGEALTRLGEGGPSNNKSLYNTILDIRELMWEGVGKLGDLAVEKQNEKKVKDNNRISEYYINAASLTDDEEQKNLYLDKAKEYGEKANNAYASNATKSAQKYNDLEAELSSHLSYEKTKKILDQYQKQINDIWAVYGNASPSVDEYRKLSENYGYVAELGLNEGQEERLLKKMEKYLPEKAFVEFEQSLMKGSESLNNFVNDINGSQTRMTKARTTYENSPYWQRIQGIEQYYKDEKLKSEINTNSQKYISKDGTVRLQDIPFEYRKRFYEIMLSDASQLKISQSDLFINQKGAIDERNRNQWDEFRSNLQNEFLPAFNQFTNKYKNINLKNNPYSLFNSLANGDTELSMKSFKNFEQTRFKFVNELNKLKNENKDNAELKNDIDTLLYILNASTASKGFDVSNVQFLNKNASPLLWQNVMGNALGINAQLIKQLSEGTQLGTIGKGSGKNGAWTGGDIFNKIYKDNLAERKTFSGLMTNLLKNGYSLEKISKTIEKDENSKRDNKNDLDYINWQKSSKNLQEYALSQGVAGQESVLSELESRQGEVINLLASGVSTQEELDKIVDPKSELGTAFNYLLDNLEDSGKTFKENVTEAANKFLEETKPVITSLKLGLSYSREKEQLQLDNTSKMLGIGFLSQLGDYSLEYGSAVRNIDTYLRLLGETYKTLKESNFNGVFKSEEERKKFEELDNKIQSGKYSKEDYVEWFNTLKKVLLFDDNLNELNTSIENLTKSTNQYNKALESANLRSKIISLSSDIRASGDNDNEDNNKPLSELKGRKYRTVMNSQTKKDMLSLLGMDEDLRLPFVYKEFGEQIKNSFNNPDFNELLEKEDYKGINSRLDKELEDSNILIDDYQSKVLEQEKVVKDTKNRTEKALKAFNAIKAVNDRNNAEAKESLNNAETDSDFLEAVYNENQILDEYEKNINKFLENEESKLVSFNETLNLEKEKNANIKNEKKTNLLWNNGNLFSDKSLEDVTNNNKDLLSLVGNYFTTGNHADRWRKEIKKKYGEDSAEYQAFDEQLKNITLTDENGEVLGFDESKLMNVLNLIYQIGEMDGFDKLSEGITTSTASLAIMGNTLEGLAKNFKEAFDTTLLNGYLSTTKLIGENLYNMKFNALDTADAEKKLANNAKSAVAGLLEQTGALLTNAGLAIAKAGALDKNGPNWAAVAGGLLMAAAGGIVNISSGWLNASTEDSNSNDDRLERIEALKDNLANLIEQARNDAEYYESTLRHKKALSYNEELSTTKVNDMILTPQGNFSTSPQDYIIATKNPQSLSNSSSPNISFSVINNGEPIQIQSSSMKKDNNGNMDIEVIINSTVKKGMLHGEYDDTFTALQSKIQGNTVSA